MIYLAKYNTAFTFEFPMVKAGEINFAVTGDWTPATGDTKISKDGGDVANTSNNPAAVGGTGSALWTLTLTATEMQAARIVIQLVDSATKAVEDQAIIIATYGNASAQHAFDLDAADVNVGSVSANAINDAGLDPDTDTYQAKVWIIDDDVGGNDHYVFAFFKNGKQITSGVTVPTVWVYTAAASPANLVGTSGAPQALTEAGTTETWFHDEGGSRIADGAAYFARVRFTVDGSEREWTQPIGRDSTS